jgi:hypothetical protein
MEANSPFRFGKIVNDISFVNRTDEIQRLIENFKSSISITLISPRRWGKSSLVSVTANKLTKENKNFKIVMIDLFGVNSEEAFYKKYATEVIKATENNFEGWARMVSDFLGKISPKLTYSPNKKDEFGLTFEWNNQTSVDEILKLPEKIAQQKNIQILICIDEFQNINELGASTDLQKKLRSVWQKFSKTTFCLYGSKRSMMTDYFHKKSMPFYKFGEVMFLEKINEKHWEKYIVSSFKKTNKLISKTYSLKIASLMKNHPYYVQQLAHNVWINTSTEVNDEVLVFSVENMLLHNAIFYRRIVEDLSATQLNLLICIAYNEKQLSAKKTIETYRLGSSASVTKAKKALEDKEIIDTFSGELLFDDPAFELWFKHTFLQFKFNLDD